MTYDKNRWISRQEAAFLLGVPLTVIDRLIATGVLARYRIRHWDRNGRRDLAIRVLRAEVDELKGTDPEVLRNA